MKLIDITRSQRGTSATTVNIFGVRVYFSYDTAVGCNPPDAPSFMRHNEWGPTTGRHLNEWGFKCPGLEKLDEDEFNDRMNQAIFRAMSKHVAATMGVAA